MWKYRALVIEISIGQVGKFLSLENKLKWGQQRYMKLEFQAFSIEDRFKIPIRQAAHTHEKAVGIAPPGISFY